MPFTAIQNDEIVWPDEVSDGATVTCPECNHDMHVRSGHTTVSGVLKPRCFSHNPESPVGGMCSGGESDTHKMMKYVVDRRLSRMYEHATVERERPISGTERIGDVVVLFDKEYDEFGKGVIAEVQHKNDQKNLSKVTKEYLKAGFSVYWINKSHFDNDMETVDLPDLVPVWPNAVPTPAEWSGLELTDSELFKFGKRHKIDAILPIDYIGNNRDIYEKWWNIGKRGYKYDIVRVLSENSATRRCSSCVNEADVYLYDSDRISTFRCGNHLPGDLTMDQVEEIYSDV